jgi:hypothetical protein
MPNQPSVKVRTQYASTYRQISVSAFNGNATEKGIELTAYTDEQDFVPPEQPDPNTVYLLRTLETHLTINPMQAKSLHEFLGLKLKEYEEIYGAIPTFEDVKSRIEGKMQARGPTNMDTSKKPSFGIQ